MYNKLEKPIPFSDLPDTSVIGYNEKAEGFVDINEYSDGRIKVSMQYFEAGLNGSINKALVRKGVADRLLKALKLLPEGYTFEILDAWRPYDVQLSLFNGYYNQIKEANPDILSKEELHKKTLEFVSYPDKSKKFSFVHSSGGAVDITIIDNNGNRLDMGSEFDEFTDRSYTDWYEKNDINGEIRNNRRLLYSVLCSCGFTNYPSEWWHYDYGDIFWSYYTGQDAIYSSAFELSEVN
ncbi:MAG: M15 family metallopeptidase [Ruminiclostridium sp.]|nr:M15 family metallopeptidase [Ruminiclostridium sp.]